MLWQLLPAVAVVGAVALSLAAINARAVAEGNTAAAAAAAAAAASGFGVSTAGGLAACRVVLSRLAVLDSVGL